MTATTTERNVRPTRITPADRENATRVAANLAQILDSFHGAPRMRPRDLASTIGLPTGVLVHLIGLMDPEHRAGAEDAPMTPLWFVREHLERARDQWERMARR